MEYKPAVNSLLHIGDNDYYFTEHPAARGMPYGISGQRAIVYQLRSEDGGLRALKIFPPYLRFQRYAEIGEILRPYGKTPGLQACRRIVITPLHHSDLLSRYDNLEFSILMPWVTGETWQDCVMYRRAFSPERCKQIALSLVTILVKLEENGLAHCDLCGPNVLLPGLHSPTTHSASSRTERSLVALVDLDDIYIPDLDPPENLPRVMRGYSHRTTAQSYWKAEADRFAGAVLISEILAWFNDSIRQISFGEQFFDPTELQNENSERFQAMYNVIQTQWGSTLANLLETAWTSRNLHSCPPLSEWARQLGAPLASTTPAQDVLTRLNPEGIPSQAPIPGFTFAEITPATPKAAPVDGSPASKYHQALTAIEKADSWVQHGQLDEAIKELEIAYKLDPELAGKPLIECYLKLARDAEATNDLEAALLAYEKILAIAPNPTLKDEATTNIMEIRYQIELGKVSRPKAGLTCPQCESELDRDMQACPICGYVFMHNVIPGSLPLPVEKPAPSPVLPLPQPTTEISERKNKKWVLWIGGILLALMMLCGLSVICGVYTLSSLDIYDFLATSTSVATPQTESDSREISITPTPTALQPLAPTPTRSGLSPSTASGAITGKLTYPGSLIPPLKIVAFNIETGKWFFVEVRGTTTYFLGNLPAGTYRVVAYTIPANEQQIIAAGYTRAVPCGLDSKCTDHTLLDVIITGGQITTGIDPIDWYAPEGTFPKDPTR